MRSAMNLRYSLLPFLYTLFHHAHSSATTVARPLFMEYVSFLPTLISSRFLFLPLTSAHSFCAPLYRFPTDLNCKSIDQQFLWGGSLLISPVLKQGAVKVAAYLPLGTWYSLHNVSANTVFYWIKWNYFLQFSLFCSLKGQPFYSEGQFFLLPAPLDTINVHMREGHIIPQQVT